MTNKYEASIMTSTGEIITHESPSINDATDFIDQFLYEHGDDAIYAEITNLETDEKVNSWDPDIGWEQSFTEQVEEQLTESPEYDEEDDVFKTDDLDYERDWNPHGQGVDDVLADLRSWYGDDNVIVEYADDETEGNLITVTDDYGNVIEEYFFDNEGIVESLKDDSFMHGERISVHDFHEALLTETSANSNGVYSLFNGWLKTPIKDDIPDVDLEPELSEWIERANNCSTEEEVDNFIDDIYQLRQASIIADGEYGKGNLIFKEIRNQGILQGLKDKKTELQNQEMSLESLDINESASGWDDSWRDKIPGDVLERLAECRNFQRDLPIMAKAMWKVNPDKSAEDCLDRIIEWVCEWNSQSRLYPDEPGEYEMLLNKIQGPAGDPRESLEEETELNEASADKEKFIDKFGQEAFDTFWNNKQRLKQMGVNVDILWHVKNTSVEQMNEIIDKINSTMSKNQEEKEAKKGAEKLYSDQYWDVYKLNTYEASKYYGKNTMWCLSGNYPGHEGEGQYWFNYYLNNGWTEYILYIDKTNNTKYLALTSKYDPERADVWDPTERGGTTTPLEWRKPLFDKTVPGQPPVLPGHPNVTGVLANGDRIIKDKLEKIYNGEITDIPNSYLADLQPRPVGQGRELFEITLPDTVKSIGKRAFMAFTTLTSINIPTSVESIGDGAFMGCVRLKKMTIPEKFSNDLERIGIPMIKSRKMDISFI